MSIAVIQLKENEDGHLIPVRSFSSLKKFYQYLIKTIKKPDRYATPAYESMTYAAREQSHDEYVEMWFYEMIYFKRVPHNEVE